MVARAEVIRDIGGFQALGYTLTEDADLIAAAGAKKWKVRVSSKRSTMITTFPQPGWKQFVNHHIRWNSGGYYSSNLSTALGYRFIVLYLVFSVAVIPFSLLLPLLLILPVTSFITIGLLGFLAGLLYRKDKVAYLLRLVPYTLFFMVFYAFVTVLSIIKVTPEWKGKKLKATE
jgi:cellulose synthase/poly-beta-1,6-N-acetylglucosamine synthase-like glycosyltransferase